MGTFGLSDSAFFIGKEINMKKTYLDMDKKLRRNGYYIDRWKGSHAIYSNGTQTVAVNIKLNEMVARRITKECGLS